MLNEIVISESLTLSPITEDDADPLFALIDKNRSHLKEWLPWLDFNTTADDSAAFIDRSIQTATNNTAHVLTITYQNSLCGIIGFNAIESLHGVCEIGYWIDAEHQGFGIITRSVTTLINTAFKDLKLNKVCIPVAELNTKSRKVPERLGFKIEGIAREAEWLYDHYVDHVLYALLKSEWQNSHGS